MKIRTMMAADVDAVIALWQRCGLTRPWNDPRQDLAFAAAGPSSAVLVQTAKEAVVGAVMVGHDGHRGTVYYLGVDPAQRRVGGGASLMRAAEAWLRQRGVWKLNLLVRETNAEVIGFYEALGYQDQACRVMGKRLDDRADRTPVDGTDSHEPLPEASEER
ncbi:MAG: GNAT family acetyltransferase [Pseudomonadota bacterium]